MAYDSVNRRLMLTDAKGNTRSLGYDANSNVTTAVDSELSDLGSPTQVFTSSLAYDNLNRRITTTDNVGNAFQYAYDCFGRRVNKVVDADGSASETRFVYDGWEVCEELDSLSATLATYVFGNAIDEVLTMNRAGVDRFFHEDDMGNVMKLTDASGAVSESYDYGDYGQPLDSVSLAPISGSGLGTPVSVQRTPFRRRDGLVLLPHSLHGSGCRPLHDARHDRHLG